MAFEGLPRGSLFCKRVTIMTTYKQFLNKIKILMPDGKIRISGNLGISASGSTLDVKI